MKRLTFILAILLFSTNFVLGQDYYFKHFRSEDGLSHNTVLNSLQDKTGFLWFGTKDGLNRFDGYTFKIFHNDPDNPKSIGSNFIECLNEFNDELWVGTDNGLYRYNEKFEDFTILEGTTNKPILDIENDNNGNLWYISGFILYRYDINLDKTFSYENKFSNNIEEVTKTIDGNIWIASLNSIFKYSKASDSFKKIDVNIETKNNNPIRISKLFSIDESSILIGTQNNGVIVYNIYANTFKNLMPELQDFFYVRDFLLKDNNELWIATETGLIIYNLETSVFKNLKKKYNDPYSISDNAIYSLTIDNEGGVWIGTYFGGIDYYPKQYFQFNKYFPKLGENSISGNAVREIHSDKYGNLWIGTEDAGLNKYNPNTKSFINYKPTQETQTISHYNIHGLLINDDKIWIGTFDDGIDIMDINTGKVVKHYKVGDGHGLLSNFIYTFYQNKSNEIFVITSSGIFLYNSETDKFMVVNELPRDVFYTSLIEDNSGNYWAGTYWDGLVSYNSKTKSQVVFKHSNEDPNSISSNAINNIFQDSNNNLWITTENGLNLYDYEKNKFIKYTTKNGFPSNVIYSIIEDENKILWISTSKGLVEFKLDSEEIKIYTKENGLLNNHFNYNSAFNDKKGTIYFGSVKGMISFNPKKIIENTFLPPILITGLEINNKEVQIHENNSSLSKSITFTKEIVLKPNETSINLHFAALSFTAPEMTEYSYKLEGLSDEWVTLQKNHKVYFTGLSPGDYYLSIKALNSNSIWSETPNQLKIVILPPIWKSNLAYTIYMLLITIMIIIGFRFYHQRLEVKNTQIINALNNKKEKELYQAKIEFFTNLSHEIRTPLSLIKIPLEKLLNKGDLNLMLKDNLSIMNKNVTRLLNLVNQLLDFRKTELEATNLTFVKTNISELIRKTYTRFSQTIESNDVDFELELGNNDIYAFVDAEAILKILSNLFNNALKYANKNILLTLKSNKSEFILMIQNDGNLIPSHLKDKIFEPFYRVPEFETQNHQGTGIGLSLALSLAELHKGMLKLDSSDSTLNSFILKIPIHQEKEFDLYESKKLDINENTEYSSINLKTENNRSTILLVEDNEDLLDFVAKDLMDNYIVIKTTNAEKALEIVNDESIHIVISDVMMPGIDGFVFCEKMKTNLETSHIPIVLLTAKTAFGAKITGLESGADAYIEKPFSMDYLKVVISNLLENRKNIMEHYSSSPLAHVRSIAHTKLDEVFIKKLDGIIYDNISDHNLSVEVLAENMNMSRSTLYRKIKEISNLTPNDLINITRLKKAAEYLKTGNYKIYEVAELVGYNSQTSFGRSFQKQFNMSPREYMKSD